LKQQVSKCIKIVCVFKNQCMHVTFSFAFYSRYAQTRTSNFSKEVWQHTEGMVGSIIWILLEIYFSFQQWKNFENPLRTDKVIAMSLVYGTFLGQCVYLPILHGEATSIQRNMSKEGNLPVLLQPRSSEPSTQCATPSQCSTLLIQTRSDRQVNSDDDSQPEPPVGPLPERIKQLRTTDSSSSPAISINIFTQSLKSYLFDNYSDWQCFILHLHVFCFFVRFRHCTRFRDSFCLASVF